MCPIIGEIQMYELSNKTNATFETHTKSLYTLFKSKGMQNLPANQKDFSIEDMRAVVQEVW